MIAAAASAPVLIEAPGKVMLTGDYAVLCGAPALMLAIDRYARCRIEPAAERGGGWRVEAAGAAAARRLTADDLQGAAPPDDAALWWHALRRFEVLEACPAAHGSVDTRGFYEGTRKLGLGSSAAASTAIYGALCRLLGRHPSLSEALALHRDLQHGAGSGADVAASFTGGRLRFEAGHAAASDALAPLRLRFIWTGQPADTRTHIARFDRWRGDAEPAPLSDLVHAARAVFTEAHAGRALQGYADALQALDRAAGLGIFTAAHQHLYDRARQAGICYKPCGAGGGDLGLAASADPEQLDRFVYALPGEFRELQLETAPHGIATAI